MPIVLASVAAAILVFFLDDLAKYFRVSALFSENARWYWKLGLVNLILRTLSIPLTAILIACNQRMKCTLLAAGVLLSKLAFGWFAIHIGPSLKVNSDPIIIPMLIIGSGSIVALFIASVIAVNWISKLVDGWKKMELKSLVAVWPGELGIGAISAFSPVIFGFQIAKVNTSPGFFVTYQLALHFTYIITLPVLAGMQIAVRDASGEQLDTLGISFKPLHESRWWPQFFYASLVPSWVLLLITSIFAKPIFSKIYNYPVPKDHLPFLPIFFLSWILWQMGNVYLIMLRASKRNSLATWNFIVAGFGVQVGLTQFLLWNNRATPFTLSLVILAYCASYLLLNWIAISEIQSKYYLLKSRLQGKQTSKLGIQLPSTQHLPSNEHLIAAPNDISATGSVFTDS